MQSLTAAYLKAIFHKLFIPRKHGSFADPVSSVPKVIEHGMSDRFHMDPNLMGTTSFQPAFDQRNVIESLENLVMSHGMPTFHIGIIVQRRKKQSAYWLPGDWLLDSAFRRIRASPYDGQVTSFWFVIVKLAGQLLKDLGVFGDHQQSAGIFVKPMHQSGTIGIISFQDWQIRLFYVIRECIHQGSLIIAISRVHHHAGRFMDYQQVFVFVPDIQGYVLRYHYAIVCFVDGGLDGDLVAGSDLVVGLDFRPVHLNPVISETFLYF